MPENSEYIPWDSAPGLPQAATESPCASETCRTIKSLATHGPGHQAAGTTGAPVPEPSVCLGPSPTEQLLSSLHTWAGDPRAAEECAASSSCVPGGAAFHK